MSYLLWISSRASSLVRVMFCCLQDDGRRDWLCFTKRWEQRTWVGEKWKSFSSAVLSKAYSTEMQCPWGASEFPFDRFANSGVYYNPSRMTRKYKWRGTTVSYNSWQICNWFELYFHHLNPGWYIQCAHSAPHLNKQNSVFHLHTRNFNRMNRPGCYRIIGLQ